MREASEKALDGSVRQDAYGFRGGNFWEPGHGHDIAGQRHHEAGSCGGIYIPDGEPEAGRTAQLVRSSEKEYWVLAMQTGVCPKPIASHCAMFFSAAAE